MDAKSFNIRVPKRWVRVAMIVGATALIVAPLTAIAMHNFDDVPNSNTFHADIAAIADAGVTLGCNPPDNDEYCPDDFVTREQMAAFMNRLGALGPGKTPVANAATAVEAQTADSATTADDANLLDGMDSSEFVTKLFVSVNSDCTAVDRHNGAVSVDLDFPSRCDVQFDQQVNICTPQVSGRGSDPGELAAVTNRDGAFVSLATNEVGVTFRNSAGALDGPNAFHLTLACDPGFLAADAPTPPSDGPTDDQGHVTP